MFEKEISQGTVIYGIRSEKYPTTPCYGIIITARCDIAQGKVSKYHYLVAVDASAWLCSKHGYIHAYNEVINSKKREIIQKATNLELDGESLLLFSQESLDKVFVEQKLQRKENRKSIAKIEELQKAIKKYNLIAQANANDRDRGAAIQENSPPAFSCLRDISLGKFHHYCFLPQTAYLKKGIKSKGLIVDLLEIKSLSLDDARKIASPFPPHISFSELPMLPSKDDLEELAKSKDDQTKRKMFLQIAEHLRLETSFWLETDSDFVGIEGTIASPWCEHLMQRFSNVFSRIGLENPTEEDFKTIVCNCHKEEKK